MNNLKRFLLFIWQLPQNLLGLILILFYGNCKKYFELNDRRFYYTNKMPSGISLGNYIILNLKISNNSLAHEYGHSIQSRYLGPLYLLIIGLPSLLGNIYAQITHKSLKWYYNQPWEKWADKLGRVDRYYYE